MCQVVWVVKGKKPGFDESMIGLIFLENPLGLVFFPMKGRCDDVFIFVGPDQLIQILKTITKMGS